MAGNQYENRLTWYLANVASAPVSFAAGHTAMETNVSKVVNRSAEVRYRSERSIPLVVDSATIIAAARFYVKESCTLTLQCLSLTSASILMYVKNNTTGTTTSYTLTGAANVYRQQTLSLTALNNYTIILTQSGASSLFVKTDSTEELYPHINAYVLTSATATATGTSANASTITSGTLSSSVLPTTAVSVGTYGTLSNIPIITVDSTGRITDASNSAPLQLGTTNASELISGTLDAARLPSSGINASTITIGTLSSNLLPSSGVNASAITIGTLSSNVLPSSGVNASSITVGTLSSNVLPSSGVTAGIYGSSTLVPVMTVDVLGRVTNVTTIGVSGGGGGGSTNASDLTSGTLSDTLLPLSGVSAGTFGDSSNIPIVSVDDKGRVTAITITNVTTALNASAISSGTLSSSVLEDVAGAGTFGESNIVAKITVDTKGRVTAVAEAPIVLQPSDVTGLSTVATTGNYDDLFNKTFTIQDTSNAVFMSGNVGIGTLTPSAGVKLEVVGTVKATNFIGNINASLPDPLYVVGGNVGVGTDTPTATFEVNGSIKATQISGVLDATSLPSPLTIGGEGSYVGIGSTVPVAALDVGTGTVKAAVLEGSIDGAFVSGRIGASSAPLPFEITSSNVTVAQSAFAVVGSNESGLSTFAVTNTGTGNALWLSSNVNAGVPHMVVKRSGRVGIMRDNPEVELHVNGSIKSSNLELIGNMICADTISTSNLTVTGDFVRLNTLIKETDTFLIRNLGTSNALRVYQDGAGSTYQVAEFVSYAGPAMMIANSGMVGVGSTQPAFKLDVDGDVNFTGNLYQDGVLFVSGTNASEITAGTLNAARLPLSGITSGSYGNASSVPILTVDDKGRVTAASLCNISISAMRVSGLAAVAQSGLYSSLSNVPWTTSGLHLLSTNTGNIGIGSATPGKKLDVLGTVRATAFEGDGALLTNIAAANVVGSFGAGTIPSPFTISGANVGIGSTSPLRTLHVQGDINFSGNLYQNNVLFTGASGNAQWTKSGNNLYYQVGGSGQGNVGINTTNPTTPLFVVGNSVITGNIGIGTTNPQGRIHAVGGTSIIHNMVMQSFNKTLSTTALAWTSICTVTANHGAYIIYLDVVHSESASSEAKSYTIPVQWVALNANWYTCLPLSSGAFSNNDWRVDINISLNIATLRLVRVGGTISTANFTCVLRVVQSEINTAAISDLTTTGTSAATVGIFESTCITQVNSNVGIFTATPTVTLDVNGTIFGSNILTCAYISNATARPAIGTSTIPGEIRAIGCASSTTPQLGADDGLLRLSAGGGTGSTTKSFIDLNGFSTLAERNRTITFGTAGVERMRISSDGNVGIGTTTPLAKLSIQGNVIASGDIGGFGSASDARLKKDVTEMEENAGLLAVCQLRPVDFTWVDDIFNEQKRGLPDVGFIAQEVAEVLPKVVKSIQFPGASEEYLGVSYEKLVPYLVKAIQEQQKQIDNLKEVIIKSMY